MHDIVTQLEKIVNENKDHPFNRYERYYKFFVSELSNKVDIQLFSRKKVRDSLWRKLQLNTSYNPNSYSQGICEILLWLFLINSGQEFAIEKKVSEVNETDVDIQIVDDYIYNIEIKCPELVNKKEKNVLKLHPAFRTVDKSVHDEAVNDFIQDIINPAIKSNKLEYSEINVDKINDNKMSDYLKSAQKKFPNSSESICNILFIGTTTKEIQDYFAYLENGYSGIFKGVQPIISADKYNHIDVVILSNIVDGHYIPDETFNSWKLESFFNLMIINPNNKDINPDARNRLLQIIPNSTLQFEEFYKDYCKTVELEATSKNEPLLGEILMPLLFPHYFDKYYRYFWREK